LDGIAATINGTAVLSAQNVSDFAETEPGVPRLVIRDTDGNNFTPADSGALFSTLGVASNSTSQSAFVHIRNDFAQNPDLLSRGTLNPAVAVGSTALSIGNGTIASNMAGVFSSDINFARAGSVATTTTTLSRYTAQVIEIQASLASDNQSRCQHLRETGYLHRFATRVRRFGACIYRSIRNV